MRHHAEIGESDGEGRLAAFTVLPEARPDPIMLRIIRQGRIYSKIEGMITVTDHIGTGMYCVG